MPIHDQSYRRYGGARQPAQRAWLVKYAGDFLATLFAGDPAAVGPDRQRLGIDVTEPPAGSGPMFLAVATDDTLGLTTDSIELYQRWRAAGLPVEFHAYARGGHGFGMRVQHLPSDTWIDRFLQWHTALE